MFCFFFSSRRRHTRCYRDWSSDVCSSDLDATIMRRLVEFLQQSDFAGVILTRDKLEGTFGFEEAKIDPPSPGYGAASNEHVPDVAMAFHWNDAKNRFGVPGMIDADWNRAAGKGTHA